MADWPKLSYVVRGMKKRTSGRTKRPRLPITPKDRRGGGSFRYGL